MRLRDAIVCGVLLIAAAAPAVCAPLEQQARTYDLTLDDCLAQTLQRYPEIQALRTELERAAGTRIVYRSRALADLNGQATVGLRGGNLYKSPEIDTNPRTGVISTNSSRQLVPSAFSAVWAQLSQPLIDLGIPPSLRRGRLEVVIAEQALNREVTDRLHEARTTFLRALYLRDRIALHDEIEKRLEANVDAEQRRFDVGTGGREAVAAAKVQALNLKLETSDLRGEYLSVVTRIAALCGLNPRDEVNGSRQLWLPRPVGELEYAMVNVDVPQESAYAVQHRADLKLLRALIDATAADRQTTRAGYFPTVSLIGSGLFIPDNYLLTRQTQIVTGQQTQSSEGRLGVAMAWQVIDTGQVTGESQRLEAVREGYQTVLHKLEQNVPRELAAVEGSLQDADARHEALVQSVAQAGESLNLIEAQVALGQATQLDFLKAQNDLLRVREVMTDAVYSHEVARAELDRVTGRYLQFHFDDPQ
ncbi:MAG TPA: TolC family protein [Verrucomicrobiae bacterium]|nr:TolC family protein [Verrucomicrobiae bacterium]